MFENKVFFYQVAVCHYVWVVRVCFHCETVTRTSTRPRTCALLCVMLLLRDTLAENPNRTNAKLTLLRVELPKMAECSDEMARP